MASKALAIGMNEFTCIYCKRDSRASRSRPHVFPECIAENPITLPVGVECDDCNSKAGKLEQAICQHQRIGKVAFIRGVPGKGGHVRRRHGVMKRDPATGNISVEGISKVISHEEGRIEIAAPDERLLDDGRFRRGLYHIALNHLALVAGSSMALEPRFDGVRRYVRLGDPKKSWRYAQVPYDDASHRKELGCRFLRSEAGTVIKVMTFLDDFFVNLEGDEQLEAWGRQWLPRHAGFL